MPWQRQPALRAVWAYPVVGVVVGAVGGGVNAAASRLGCGALVAAFWAVAAQIWLTGALHEDGLADTADGFGGGRDTERKLTIMRDSHIGAFGAIALIMVLGVRVAAISERPGWLATWALMAAGASGRAAMLLLLILLRPARRDGVAADLRNPPAASVAVGVIFAVVIDLTGGGWALLAGALACLAVAYLAQRNVGGYTGDVLGATEQTVEAVVLSVFVGWVS